MYFDSLRDFPLSGVGDENNVEDVRLLIVSVLEVRWVFWNLPPESLEVLRDLFAPSPLNSFPGVLALLAATGVWPISGPL